MQIANKIRLIRCHFFLNQTICNTADTILIGILLPMNICVNTENRDMNKCFMLNWLINNFQASSTSIQMSPRKPSNGVDMNGSELNRNGNSETTAPPSKS